MPLPDLTCLYWTNCGLYPGTGEISPYPFEKRVKAAAQAGFRGVGLWCTDLEHIMVHQPLRDVKAMMDDNGIRHLELEFLTDWFVDGARRRESDSRRKRLLEASAALGASHVKIGDFYNTPCSMPQLVEAFAGLCAEAATFGATIGFEFMGSAMLNTLSDSLTMVQQAGAANGGVIVDIAHTMALGISHAEVAQIPKQYLVCVELNDNVQPGSADYNGGTRRFCGEGEFDLAAFIAAVKSTGYDRHWAVEVFSPELPGLPLDELTTRAFETTASQFRPNA